MIETKISFVSLHTERLKNCLYPAKILHSGADIDHVAILINPHSHSDTNPVSLGEVGNEELTKVGGE